MKKRKEGKEIKEGGNRMLGIASYKLPCKQRRVSLLHGGRGRKRVEGKREIRYLGLLATKLRALPGRPEGSMPCLMDSLRAGKRGPALARGESGIHDCREIAPTIPSPFSSIPSGKTIPVEGGVGEGEDSLLSVVSSAGAASSGAGAALRKSVRKGIEKRGGEGKGERKKWGRRRDPCALPKKNKK